MACLVTLRCNAILLDILAGISWVECFTFALTASSKTLAMRLWMLSEQVVVTGSDSRGEASALYLRDLFAALRFSVWPRRGMML